MNVDLHRSGLNGTLKNSPLFSNLQLDILKFVTQHAQKIHCNKNESIQVNSGREDYFYIVDSGAIMLSRVTHDGERVVLDILKQGGVFGINPVFQDNNNTHLIAEGLTSARLWRIPISALQEVVRKDNAFTHNFLCMNLTTRLAQELELEHRTVQSAPQRIGCFLLSQCSGDAESKNIMIKLPYSKTTVAAKLGVRPETFSRALQMLEIKTGLRARGSKVHIPDIDRLKSFVCTSCSLQ